MIRSQWASSFILDPVLVQDFIQSLVLLHFFFDEHFFKFAVVSTLAAAYEPPKAREHFRRWQSRQGMELIDLRLSFFDLQLNGDILAST